MTTYMPKEASENMPVAILMHGIMANKNMHPIKLLGKTLAEAGIAAVSFDFNGHGRSYGKFRDMTIPNEVEDAIAVFNYLKAQKEFGKIFMVGHSQGGVVASLCAGQLKDELAGVILLAPAAVVYDDMNNGCIMGKSFDPVNPPDSICVMLHQLGKGYILAGQKLDIYGEISKYSGPLCVMHGTQDKIVPDTYAMKYNTVCAQAKLMIFDNENHMFSADKARMTNHVLDFLKPLI